MKKESSKKNSRNIKISPIVNIIIISIGTLAAIIALIIKVVEYNKNEPKVYYSANRSQISFPQEFRIKETLKLLSMNEIPHGNIEVALINKGRGPASKIKVRIEVCAKMVELSIHPSKDKKVAWVEIGDCSFDTLDKSMIVTQMFHSLVVGKPLIIKTWFERYLEEADDLIPALNDSVEVYFNDRPAIKVGNIASITKDTWLSNFRIPFIIMLITIIVTVLFAFLVKLFKEPQFRSAIKNLLFKETFIYPFMTLFEEPISKKIEQEIKKLRNQISFPSLSEAPSEELKKKLNDYEKRIELLERFGTSLQATDYFTQGVNFYYKDKYELALQSFKKAIEIEPDYVEAWMNKGVALNKIGLHAKALIALKKAIELAPNYAEAWLNKGVALDKLGLHVDALKTIDKAIELKPDCSKAWYNKGVELEKLSHHKEALKTFERTIELDHNYTKAWYNKGVALAKLNLHEKALKALEKAIELDPNYAEAWYNKGVALGKLGLHEDALKAFDKTIEINSNFINAWVNKGAVLGSLSLHEKALKALEKAIELAPNYAEAWYNKGIALDKLDLHEDALKAFDKTIEIKPEFAEAWYNKACIYSLKDNLKSALSNLSKAIELKIEYKEKAKKDENFRNLWGDEDFTKITT